jgi:hypothetical protein
VERHWQIVEWVQSFLLIVGLHVIKKTFFVAQKIVVFKMIVYLFTGLRPINEYVSVTQLTPHKITFLDIVSNRPPPTPFERESDKFRIVTRFYCSSTRYLISMRDTLFNVMEFHDFSDELMVLF